MQRDSGVFRQNFQEGIKIGRVNIYSQMMRKEGGKEVNNKHKYNKHKEELKVEEEEELEVEVAWGRRRRRKEELEME